ncbi:MAG: SDR family oxidoreductase [Pseudomonadota bacterium]
MSNNTERHILVTAGASGIGRCIAEAFLNSGARVHVVDVDQDALKEFERCFPEAVATEADVADEKAVDGVFEKQSALGDLSVLVNCAGIKGPTEPVDSMDFDEWRRCIAVNLDAAFLCCRRAIPMLKRTATGHQRSSIINISSTAGWHGYPYRSPYASAKWGVIGLTKSLAMELGAEGVRVNAVCPGTVDGDRMDRVIRAEAEQKGVAESEIREAYTRGCSLREMISGSDIADTVFFLASDAAGKITGQAINVDGHLESFAVS